MSTVCCVKINISIVKYHKINMALFLNRIMLQFFGSSYFRCFICYVWSSSQSGSEHRITLINASLYVKNASGAELLFFTLIADTLLISLSFSFFPACNWLLNLSARPSSPLTGPTAKRPVSKSAFILEAGKQRPDVKTVQSLRQIYNKQLLSLIV